MSVEKTAFRRMTAGAGAVALALVGLGVGVTAAHAEVGPDQPNAPEVGTLTINKYAGLPLGPDDELNPADLLDGVEFTVRQVGVLDEGVCAPIDLTVATQWDGLDGLFASAPAAPTDPFCLITSPNVGETEDGTVEFNLPVGVYYVQETDPGGNPIVSPVPNFYVSIPTSTGAGGDGWNYDVIANPKNQLMDAPSKTISEAPSALTVGSNVTWIIEIPIPALADEEDEFTSGSVTDVLDSRLSYVSSTVKIGEDDLVHTLDDEVVKWTFNNAQLLANQGQTITIELVTRVNSVGDGQIISAGGNAVDGGYWSEFNDAEVPGTTSPESYWGQLSILKTDDSNPVNNLQDAEFQVFDLATCPAIAPETGAIATGISGANGIVQWADGETAPTATDAPDVLGLWVANSNGPATSPTKAYCVYETKVPAGHTATAIANPVTITPGVDATNAITVVNAKKVGPNLPLTGAQGTLAMTIGGLVLISMGAGAVVLSKRRRESADA